MAPHYFIRINQNAATATVLSGFLSSLGHVHDHTKFRITKDLKQCEVTKHFEIEVFLTYNMQRLTNVRGPQYFCIFVNFDKYFIKSAFFISKKK